MTGGWTRAMVAAVMMLRELGWSCTGDCALGRFLMGGEEAKRFAGCDWIGSRSSGFKSSVADCGCIEDTHCSCTG